MMKNSIIKSLATLIVAAGFSTAASGQYFEVGGIVYNITSESTVEVFPSYMSLSTPYSGDISIPQTVEHGGATYTVTALGEAAFESCTGVTSLTLPPTIRSIGPYCFYDCHFTTLQLPDSLRTIADHAFLYSSIESLHLPACFEEYGECAFWMRNLKSVTVDENNPHYRSIDGWLYSKDSLTLCLVPSGVTGTITVPQYVRHLGAMAFGFCSRITSVVLHEGLRSIGDFAFNCCSAVDGIVIPSSVSHIGICPFSYCPQMDNLTIAPGNDHYVMDGLILYSNGYDTLVSCHKSGTTVTINPNVKVLGGFENNTWVRNIAIPEGVTDITDNCFNGCQITTIALPHNMRSIGRKAFSENDRLTNITMPQTLLTMGQKAFEYCFSLTSIAIPDSLRVIPKDAFNSCIRLSSITWNNEIEEIGDYAFWAMSYYSATHITTLDFPASLRKVGDGAFGSDNNYLRYVRFNGPVDTLADGAFYQANLKRLSFADAMPPAVTVFGPVSSVDSIIVPCGSLNAWLADSYWGPFSNVLFEDCSGIDNAENDDIHVYTRNGRIVVDGVDGEPVAVYDIMGRCRVTTTIVDSFACLPVPTGVYMVRVGDRPSKRVVVL